MLGRLLLILIQLVVGWYAGVEIMKSMPSFAGLDIFLMAAVFAVLAWAIGLLASAVLKDVSSPGSSTLLFAFGLAILVSALTLFPDVTQAVRSVAGGIDTRLYPLVGAVVGYAISN